jgi:hypothetical protein
MSSERFVKDVSGPDPQGLWSGRWESNGTPFEFLMIYAGQAAIWTWVPCCQQMTWRNRDPMSAVISIVECPRNFCASFRFPVCSLTILAAECLNV